MKICELCYKEAPPGPIPCSWDIIFQSLVCEDCQIRAADEGKPIALMTGGYYANGKPDPRKHKDSGVPGRYQGP